MDNETIDVLHYQKASFAKAGYSDTSDQRSPIAIALLEQRGPGRLLGYPSTDTKAAERFLPVFSISGCVL